jgi:hypothetical protein
MELTGNPNAIRAMFYHDEDRKRDMVELKIVGDPNTVKMKVTPELAAQYPRDWENFQKGRGEQTIVEGTALSEVPGVDRDAAIRLRIQGVRTAEELAGLDEGQAKALGLGGLTFWKAAKQLIKLRELEALQAVVEDSKAKRKTKTEEAA